MVKHTTAWALRGLPREQVRLELTKMGKSLVMPLLRLKDVLGRQHTVPFQTDAPGFVNKKLAVSADYINLRAQKCGNLTSGCKIRNG